MAAADRAYDMLDPEGAREAGARLAAARQGVRELRADTDRLDMREVLADSAARAPAEALPGTLGTIWGDDATEEIGRELERTPAKRRASRAEKQRVSIEEQTAVLQKLNAPWREAEAKKREEEGRDTGFSVRELARRELERRREAG